MRDLRGRVEGEVLAARLGDGAAGLDRAAGSAVVHEALLHHDVGLAERLVDVGAAVDPPGVGLVRAVLLPYQRRALFEGLLRVDHDRLRVVLDDHLLGSVDHAVLVGADHDGDWVANALDLAGLQGPVAGVVDLHTRRVPDHQQRAGEVAAQLLAGVHGHHAGVLLGAGLVDRHDRRVRLGRADDRGVEHAGENHVVRVGAPPGDHPGILLALHGLPDGGHADTSSPAALRTA